MVISLEQGLHLIISVQVDWISWEKNFLASLNELEAVDDKSDLNTSIWGEYSWWVNCSHLEAPVSDLNNLGFKISNVHSRVGWFETINSFLSEVAWDEEVVIGNEEEWESLLDEALDLLDFASWVFETVLDLTEVATWVDHLRVELFKSRTVRHFCG